MIEHRVVVDMLTWEKWWNHYSDLILNTKSPGVPQREDQGRMLARLKGALESNFNPDTTLERDSRIRLDNPPAT